MAYVPVHTQLHDAVVGNKLKAVKLLLTPAYVDITYAADWTPLMLAARAGHAEIAAHLIAEKANVNPKALKVRLLPVARFVRSPVCSVSRVLIASLSPRPRLSPLRRPSGRPSSSPPRTGTTRC